MLASEPVSQLTSFNRQTTRGFTLIEILVVTVIFAALSVAVFSSVAMGLNVHKRIALSSRAYKDAVIVLEKLERELANCIEFAGIEFAGNSKSIEFCSIFNIAADGGELLPTIGRLSYTFDREKQAILKKKQAFPQSLKKTEGQGEVIASDLKKVEFSYFYRDQLTGSYQWNDYWLDKAPPFSPEADPPSAEKKLGRALPVGVRIEIQLAQDNGGLWRVFKTIFLPVAFKQTSQEGSI